MNQNDMLREKIATLIHVEAITDQHSKNHSVLNANDLADEIMSLLETQARELREEIEDMKQDDLEELYAQNSKEQYYTMGNKKGYNEALKDVLALLNNDK